MSVIFERYLIRSGCERIREYEKSKNQCLSLYWIRGGSFLSPDTRLESFLRGAKIFAKNLRGAKISAKSSKGVWKIFLNFRYFLLMFIRFLGGGLKIFSENLRGLIFFGRNWRSEKMSILSDNTPTGYLNLKKSRPLRGQIFFSFLCMKTV